ncbi:MAG: hypothetical protein A7316_03640 [Candidatus Altiarchaeales archaeon WOR_SM1_86-2]|nr:MAG: hypothetical protein A7316_03640 [Candidatus Altiarchaeales archaeon WOR_SM1_86-2]
MRLICPMCKSHRIVFSGMTTADSGGYGSHDQRYSCKDCGYTGALIIDAEEREEDETDAAIIRDLKKIANEEVKEEKYAGFFARFMAFITDWIILSIIVSLITIPVLMLLYMAVGLYMSPMYLLGLDLTRSVFLFIFASVYFVYFTVVKGATPGKSIFHLMVVDGEERNIGLENAIIRESGKIAAFFLILITLFLIELVEFLAFLAFVSVLISYLMMLVDSKKQSLWDKLTGSYVIKRKE